jgi:hypothetical protein
MLLLCFLTASAASAMKIGSLCRATGTSTTLLLLLLAVAGVEAAAALLLPPLAAPNAPAPYLLLPRVTRCGLLGRPLEVAAPAAAPAVAPAAEEAAVTPAGGDAPAAAAAAAAAAALRAARACSAARRSTFGQLQPRRCSRRHPGCQGNRPRPGLFLQ